jgi:hypothetical protein
MKIFFYTGVAALALLAGNPSELSAQCSLLSTATEDISLTSSSGGTGNRSGLAFHPLFNLYYSVNAGSAAYPIDTYNAEGVLIDSISQGFDYRGLWYNPENGQLEGNGFGSTGIFNQSLNLITGIPNGTGNNIFSANQPNNQSCGVLDTERNEIIYYYESQIHRFDRDDNSLISTHNITGLPSNAEILNNNSVAYTGCSQYEYGVYDNVNKQLLLLSNVNFIVNAIVDLPETAPDAPSFKMAYTNGLFWLYDGTTRIWHSYRIFDNATSAQDHAETQNTPVVAPNPTSDKLGLIIPENMLDANMEICNLEGRVLQSWNQTGTGRQLVDIHDLPSGLYLLRYSTSSNTGMVKFVVD